MIPHNKPTFAHEEEQAALRVLRFGWVAPGPETKAFEKEVCQFIGLPPGSAVAVSNGTSALFLALWALQAQGKKVGLPVYVCSALRNAIAMAGASEVLLDVTPGSPNLDLQALAASEVQIAIVPHMYGLPVDLAELDAQEDLTIIEDCAQSIGALVRQQHTGLQGKIGIFSFYASKLMTSGGHGGMVVSKDPSLIDVIRDYLDFDCRQDDKKRFNFQMTDLQAAVGREQLQKLPRFLERRAAIFQRYRSVGLPLLDVPQTEGDCLHPVRYRAVLQTQKPRSVIDRLAAHDVKAIVPIEDWELLGRPQDFPHAWQLTQETVSLPIYPSLTDQDVETVLSHVELHL